MTPERVTAAVLHWVRFYTTGLPRPIADRRIEEIEADLHDQVGHLRSSGVSDTRIAARLASRTIRGAAADAAWRAHERRVARTRPPDENTMPTASPSTASVSTASLTRSAVRVSGFVLAVLAVPLIGTVVSDEVGWSIADFVLAGTLLGIVAVCFEAAVRRRGNVFVAGSVAILGVAAAVVGEFDDAPGLILLGVLLIAGGAAIARRVVGRTA